MALCAREKFPAGNTDRDSKRSMKQRDAMEIFRQRAKKNPELKVAYIEEKKKYDIACKIRDRKRI